MDTNRQEQETSFLDSWLYTKANLIKIENEAYNESHTWTGIFFCKVPTKRLVKQYPCTVLAFFFNCGSKDERKGFCGAKHSHGIRMRIQDSFSLLNALTTRTLMQILFFLYSVIYLELIPLQ